MPIPHPVLLQILVGVPEGAVVGGVDNHGRPIAPTAQRTALLRSTSRDDRSLALRHQARRIRGETPSVADLGLRVEEETL